MKLKLVFYSFFILVLLVVQTTLLDYLSIYGVKPNIVIVFVIITALIRGNVEGSVVGFFAGLALDMLTGNLLGLYALLGFYLGIAAGSINRRLFRENLLVVLFFTFVYSVVYEMVIYILHHIMDGTISLLYPFTRIILPEALYNCAAAVFIYLLMIKADRLFSDNGKMARKY